MRVIQGKLFATERLKEAVNTENYFACNLPITHILP